MISDSLNEAIKEAAEERHTRLKKEMKAKTIDLEKKNKDEKNSHQWETDGSEGLGNIFLYPNCTIPDGGTQAENSIYDDKGKIILDELVQKTINKFHCFTRGNLVFFYNSENGVYDMKNDNEICKIYLDNCSSSIYVKPQKAKEFAELLRMKTFETVNTCDGKKYCNCINGIVEIETMKLLEHDQKYHMTQQFQANYRDVTPEEFGKSKFKKFLGTILDPESKETAQEAFGLLVSPHAEEVQKAFLLLGGGSNGKSALMRIMQKLIGSYRHISSIGLADFSKDFDISQAEGKITNIVMDDDLAGIKVGTIFKSMICGEPVRVNRKNKDITIMSFNMTHFFNLNRLPISQDKSRGYFRRFCIIPFSNVFGTAEEIENGKATHLIDPLVIDTIIKNELDIVLHWALNGIKRLEKNNWELTIGEATAKAWEDFREESDSAYSFFKEHIEILKKGEENKVSVSDVIAAYEFFCGQNNITAMKGPALSRQLSAEGVTRSRNKTTRFFNNIKLF